jgi:hypothetical protein
LSYNTNEKDKKNEGVKKERTIVDIFIKKMLLEYEVESARLWG